MQPKMLSVRGALSLRLRGRRVRHEYNTTRTMRDYDVTDHTARRTVTHVGGNASVGQNALRERPVIGQWGKIFPFDWLLHGLKAWQ